jgi:hypothetical protein
MPVAAVRPPDSESFTTLYNTSSITYRALNMSLEGGNAYTIAMWVRFKNYSAVEPTVLTVTDSANNVYTQWVLYFNNTLSLTSLINVVASIASPIQINRWYYIAFVSTGNGVTYSYVDGAMVSSSQSSSPAAAIANPTFTIGGSARLQIENFAVWSTMLTDAQVEQEMWAEMPVVQTASLVTATDFTQSPPAISGSGISPTLNGVQFNLAADCTASGGPVDPGPATSIDPCGPVPFSILAWIYSGAGCVISNRDETDPQHFALRVDSNGVVWAQFGSGSGLQRVSAPNFPIPANQWACIAVTYDGTTCTLFVNAVQANSAAVTVAAPASNAAPKLFGRQNGGAPADIFQGALQYLSVWNLALTPAQVQTYMYDDPTGVAGCVANFSLGENPPQDLSQLLNAVWATNALQQTYASSGWVTWSGYTVYEQGSAGINRSPPLASVEPAAGRVPFERQLLFRNPRLLSGRVAQNSGAQNVEPFGETQRKIILADFLGAASTIADDKYRLRLLARFEESLDRAFADARAGRLPRGAVDLKLEGATIVATDRATGEILGRFESLLSPGCTLWWIGFISDLLSGFLTTLSLPTPTSVVLEIAGRIVEDSGVIAVLDSIEGLSITGTIMIKMVDFLYEQGYLWQLIWAAAKMLGWAAAPRVLAKVLALFSVVPNPEQAVYIANCATALAKLIADMSNYPSACSSG